MTTNREKAAEVIADALRPALSTADGIGGDLARALAAAGLLADDLGDVTRVTVASPGGRELEAWGITDVRLDVQDGGRTLKIFYQEGEQS